ncbi:uncharacterized protein LOC106056432 isoform X1 [Biomphalaria glabrata]|uniref:Uncharacterized protein LOC106056432 isoform X1 n=2 Tax=Biomphalaria glabrata TaxID=6526 RepID=A0A9W2ZNX8_BIOGL|nr:uncharacterized protein LOC106056432 isoform X1 [Biomphalaria glabrata]XP_013068635.2 uncharacterized protein LOC106056432 isoform X1 [Biomphalaria glabrata]XP_055876757.1 uncharacterized protein LOC106056432 isoform X1 [Biomphalaria glabrata]XP_055876758.1 uncharacterized protein LOC106056432 isoform X1 [Biomphalaria glabrata]XP_055876759.1 uncharacterized protein LOC106056432 isoform X1 [Biomphalaria glabrata]XP_055876760.1 uncharacterized protein LOC106056432 isoform X1 [Biomphalaria gla
MDVTQMETFMFFSIGISFIVACQRKQDLPLTTQTIKNVTATSATVDDNISVFPITLAPSQLDHYELTLMNSGPVVIDSAITFMTHLSKTNFSQESETKLFIFQWLNMADAQKLQTVNASTSEVSITFDNHKVLPGEYTMTVAAFPINDSAKMVAYKTTKFVLTEKLNGDLILKQHLDYQRYPAVFSTKEILTAAGDLHDIFLGYRKESFNYCWYKNGLLISPEKILRYNVTKSESFTLTLFIGLNFNSSPKSNFCNDSLTRSRQLAEVDNMKSYKLSKYNAADVKCVFSKCGKFEQFLILKNALHSCDIRRVGFESWDKGIALGKPTVFNITCLGSSPSAVCFNITAVNSSVPSSNVCSPQVFLNTLNHLETIHLFNVSWIDVHVFIYNDVSRIHLVETFYIYDSDAQNLPALVFPIVFGIFGILVILVGVAYIMKIRKKPYVEVADFDFHPGLTENQPNGNSKLSVIFNTIKNLFSRNKHVSNQRTSKNDDSTRPLRRESNCYDSL